MELRKSVDLFAHEPCTFANWQTGRRTPTLQKLLRQTAREIDAAIAIVDAR